MAHITYMKVAGLAGRSKDIEIKFNRDVNIIFGVNGVGKTTLLKILHSAMFSDSSIVAGLPFDAAEVGMYSVVADREIVREFKNDNQSFEALSEQEYRNLVQRFDEAPPEFFEKVLGSRGKVKSWKSPKLKAGQIQFPDRLFHEYLPTTRLISASKLGATARRVERSLYEEDVLNESMEEELKKQWMMYFGALQNKVQSVQKEGIAKILSTVLSSGASAIPASEKLDPEIAFSLAKKFLSSHASLKMPSSRSAFVSEYVNDPRLAAVVNQIASIEEETSNLSRPRDQLQSLLNNLFINKSINLISGDIQINVAGNEGSKTIRLSQLSSGEKQALYLLIHALRADTSTLIVDEPELSMHIDWQRQLVSSIQSLNPYCQMVFATHSPEIMARVEDKCIFQI